MLPARAMMKSRGLVSPGVACLGIALLLSSLASVAQEKAPCPSDETIPLDDSVRQEIVFDARCEGPVVDPRQIPAFRAPSQHPGGISQPKLPEAARKAGHNGTAGVSVLVTEKGRVAKARLIESTGYAQLDKLALEHTSKWKLRPGTVDDKPVCSWVIFPVRFERHRATTNR